MSDLNAEEYKSFEDINEKEQLQRLKKKKGKLMLDE